MISSNTMNLVEINARDGKWFEFTEQRAKVCIVDEKCLVGRRHQLDALHEIEKCIIPLIVIGLQSILFSWVVLVCMWFMFYHHFSFLLYFISWFYLFFCCWLVCVAATLLRWLITISIHNFSILFVGAHAPRV